MQVNRREMLLIKHVITGLYGAKLLKRTDKKIGKKINKKWGQERRYVFVLLSWMFFVPHSKGKYVIVCKEERGISE